MKYAISIRTQDNSVLSSVQNYGIINAINICLCFQEPILAMGDVDFRNPIISAGPVIMNRTGTLSHFQMILKMMHRHYKTLFMKLIRSNKISQHKIQSRFVILRYTHGHQD